MDFLEAVNLLKEKIESLKSEKEQKIKEVEVKYESLISDYQKSLAIYKELNTVSCPKCDGKGYIKEYHGYHNDYDRVSCENCSQTGKVFRHELQEERSEFV